MLHTENTHLFITGQVEIAKTATPTLDVPEIVGEIFKIKGQDVANEISTATPTVDVQVDKIIRQEEANENLIGKGKQKFHFVYFCKIELDIFPQTVTLLFDIYKGSGTKERYNYLIDLL